jgi:hypothetical protein
MTVEEERDKLADMNLALTARVRTAEGRATALAAALDTLRALAARPLAEAATSGQDWRGAAEWVQPSVPLPLGAWQRIGDALAAVADVGPGGAGVLPAAPAAAIAPGGLAETTPAQATAVERAIDYLVFERDTCPDGEIVAELESIIAGLRPPLGPGAAGARVETTLLAAAARYRDAWRALAAGDIDDGAKVAHIRDMHEAREDLFDATAVALRAGGVGETDKEGDGG